MLFPDAAEDGGDGGADGADAPAPVDGDAAGDTGGSGDTGGPGDTAGGVCQTNHDRVITRAEAPFGPGFSAAYRVTTDLGGAEPFDSAADCELEGACVWDVVDVPAGTTAEHIDDTLDPAGAWWADEPGLEGATFAAVLGELNLSYLGWSICEQTQLGIYQLTDDALLLLAIVSEDQVDGTALVYDPPLPILKFPLTVGATWTADSTATGPLCNSFADYAIDWTATTTVDAAGTVKTPYGDFTDALRVNTVLERHLGIGVTPTSLRSHTFVAECFTSVAVITSAEGADDEDDGEIRDAAEIKRLSNLP